MSKRVYPSKSTPTGMEIHMTRAFQITRVRVLRTRLCPAWMPQDDEPLLSKSRERRNGAMIVLYQWESNTFETLK